MRTQRRVFEKLSESTKVELASERIELGIAQDLESVKQFNNTLDTAEKVLTASIKVNTAIKKVEKDSRYYNKYAKVVYEDLTQNIKYVQSLLKKADLVAKELGVKSEEVNGYKSANNFIIDAKKTLNRLNSNPLEFDI